MENILDIKNIQTNVPLSNYTTMRVGGMAHFFVQPTKIKYMVKIIKFCLKNKIKYYILGNGSNVIFSDKGFDGLVICTKKLNKIKIKKNVTAECGCNLYALNKKLISYGLSGMEFSYGIPGSVGGAVCMNAGAYGDDMSKVVNKVLVFDGKKIFKLNNKEIDFSYRNSKIKKNNLIVLKAWLNLKQKNKLSVEEKCIENFKKRRLTQPYEFPNSGSIFKKVENISAGKIIDDLNLKGLSFGGAQISTLHANFIVNANNATATDVIKLINTTKKIVKQEKGIDLEEEVIFIP